MELATQLGSYGVLGIFAVIMAGVIRAQYAENRAKDALILQLYKERQQERLDDAKQIDTVARSASDLTGAVGRLELQQKEGFRNVVDALNRRSSSQSTKAVVVP